ncbi:MAG: DUF533 domain-containing protein [Nitrospinota bacterium]|nr:DUF533 domain-containing protein [Nitrospinota bacterium]
MVGLGEILFQMICSIADLAIGYKIISKLTSTKKNLTADLLAAFPPGGLTDSDTITLRPAARNTLDFASKSHIKETVHILDDEIKLKAIRVMISAAMADGLVHPDEDDFIQRVAERLTMDEKAFLNNEKSNPQFIADIVSGVEQHRDRIVLFTLAILTLKADDDISAEEKLFIRELADGLQINYTEARLIISAGLSPVEL